MRLERPKRRFFLIIKGGEEADFKAKTVSWEQTIYSQTGRVINASGRIGSRAGIVARMTGRNWIDRQERDPSARFDDGYTHLRRQLFSVKSPS